MAWSAAMLEQWGIANREIDFFDLKGDLQNIFKVTLNPMIYISIRKPSSLTSRPNSRNLSFRPITLFDGCITPSISQSLAYKESICLQLSLDLLENAHLPRAARGLKFPEIRRDIAILVDHCTSTKLFRIQ